MARANRTGFISTKEGVVERVYNFEWSMGLAVSQLRKSIRSLHNEIRNSGYDKVIEVSTKSEDEVGRKLSPFNLMVNIEGEILPVESVYHGSKVFNDNGNMVRISECEYMKPCKIKQFIRETIGVRNLKLVEFNIKGKKRFDLSSKGMCFDYIHILGASQNEELGNEIMKYDCFTDLMFKRENGIGCQARSCAMYKYLRTSGLVDRFLEKPYEFEYMYRG